MQLFADNHSAGVFELWSSPQVCEYSGPAIDLQGNPIRLPAVDHADSDKILQFFMQRSRIGTGCRWALIAKESGDFLGAVGFNSLGGCCEIAYHLVPKFWGQGYAAEACLEAIAWAVAEFDASRFDAYIELENKASVRLAEQMNFVRTGEIDEGAHEFLLPIVAG